MKSGNIGRCAVGVAVALMVVVWGGVVIAPILFSGSGPVSLLVLAGVAVVFGVLAARALRSKRDEDVLTWRKYWPAFIAPSAGTATIIVEWVKGGDVPRWILNGDMVWNTAQSLFIHADSGVNPGVHPNPAPLTNLIFAIAYGPSSIPSLGSVFLSHAIVVLLIAAFASVITGIYVARRARALHPFVRSCLVFAVGWLPYSGAIMGGVIWMGHANMLASYLTLWLAWIIYTESTFGYLTRTGLLLCVSTVVAASWAPLAIVPVALAAVAFVAAVRNAWAQRTLPSKRVIVMTSLSALQLGVFAMVVTLPDLRRDGGALGQDGATPAFGPYVALGMIAVLLFAAWLTWFRARGTEVAAESKTVALGVVSVLAFSVPVLAYMFWQRRDSVTLWGYYPVKFIILLIAVVAGVLIASVASVIPAKLGLFRQSLVATTAIPLFMIVLITPLASVPALQAMVPTIGLPGTVSDEDDEAGLKILVKTFDANPFAAQIVIEAIEDVSLEHLVNNYLIQLSANRSTDAVRMYAYTLDPLNTEQVCEMIAMWDRGVTIHTREERLDAVKERLSQCSTGNFAVVPIRPV